MRFFVERILTYILSITIIKIAEQEKAVAVYFVVDLLD